MPFNNDIISPFGKKMDLLFHLSDVKRHLSFEEMQSLDKQGDIAKSTPIARKLKNGLVYQLNNDTQQWDLYNVPQQNVEKNKDNIPKNPFEAPSFGLENYLSKYGNTKK